MQSCQWDNDVRAHCRRELACRTRNNVQQEGHVWHQHSTGCMCERVELPYQDGQYLTFQNSNQFQKVLVQGHVTLSLNASQYLTNRTAKNVYLKLNLMQIKLRLSSHRALLTGMTKSWQRQRNMYGIKHISHFWKEHAAVWVRIRFHPKFFHMTNVSEHATWILSVLIFSLCHRQRHVFSSSQDAPN